VAQSAAELRAKTAQIAEAARRKKEP